MSGLISSWTYDHTGYPSALKLDKVASPSNPSPTQLLVRVKAAALNPVDIQLMNLPHLPYLPWPTKEGTCLDFSGVVESAGDESGYKPGDEVFGINPPFTGGTLREIICVDVNAAVISKKPSSWTWAQAAALPLVWLTARTTIDAVESDITKNKKLVVLGGSSGVGMYVVYLAAERGWDVLATCSGRNTEFVRGMGASKVVDYTTTSVTEEVKNFAPDAVIDCVGGTDCLYLTNRYVTIVGDKTSRLSMGGEKIYPFYPRMWIRNLMGRWGLSSLKYDCVNLKFRKDWMEQTFKLPNDNITIDSTWKFDQAKEAFERLNTGRARGKVVVTV